MYCKQSNNDITVLFSKISLRRWWISFCELINSHWYIIFLCIQILIYFMPVRRHIYIFQWTSYFIFSTIILVLWVHGRSKQRCKFTFQKWMSFQISDLDIIALSNVLFNYLFLSSYLTLEIHFYHGPLYFIRKAETCRWELCKLLLQFCFNVFKIFEIINKMKTSFLK